MADFAPYLDAVSAPDTPAPEREHALRFLINQTFNKQGRWTRQYDAVLGAACAALEHSASSPIGTMLALWVLFHVALVDAKPLHGKVERLLAALLNRETLPGPDVLEKACWLLNALSSSGAPSSLAELRLAGSLARLLQVQLYGEAVVYEALQPLKNLCHEAYCADDFGEHIAAFRASDGLAHLRQILTYPRRGTVALHLEAVAFAQVLTQHKDAALLTALVESGVLSAVAGLLDAPSERHSVDAKEGEQAEGFEEALMSTLVNFSVAEPSEVPVAAWAGAAWRAVLLLRIPGPYARPSTRRLLTQLALNLSTHEYGRNLVRASPHMRPLMAALLEQLAHAGAEPDGSDKAEATENVIAFLLNLSAVPMMRLEIAARDARSHTLRALAQRVPQVAAQVKQLEANLALKSKEADLRAWEARCKEEDFQIVEIEAPAAPFQARPHAPPRNATHSPVPQDFHDPKRVVETQPTAAQPLGGEHASPVREAPEHSDAPKPELSAPTPALTPTHAPPPLAVRGPTEAPPPAPPIVVLSVAEPATTSTTTEPQSTGTLQVEEKKPSRASADGIVGPVAPHIASVQTQSPTLRERKNSSGIMVTHTTQDGQFVEMRTRKGSLRGPGVRWDASTASSHTRVDAARVRDHRRPEPTAGRSEAEVMAEKRANLAGKFLETEMDHCLHLQNSFKIFYKPLAAGQVEGVGAKDVAVLFTNIDRLLKLTGRFFLKLNARIGQWDSATSCLGDLFVAWLSDPDVGKEYCTYMAGLEEALSLYNKRHSDNERFRTLMEDCVDEKTNWLFLPSFLQLPLYRISQYRDWLSRMRKLCPPAHADHALLGAAAAAAESLLGRMQDSETRSRNARRSVALHAAFDLTPAVGRSLVREGTVQHLAPEGGVFVTLHLFTDCLLWASPPAIAAAAPGRLLGNFALGDVTVTDLPDTSTLVNAFRFTVANSVAAPAWAAGKTLEVCTSRKSDKQEWLEALVQAQQRTPASAP